MDRDRPVEWAAEYAGGGTILERMVVLLHPGEPRVGQSPAGALQDRKRPFSLLVAVPMSSRVRRCPQIDLGCQEEGCSRSLTLGLMLGLGALSCSGGVA